MAKQERYWVKHQRMIKRVQDRVYTQLGLPTIRYYECVMVKEKWKLTEIANGGRYSHMNGGMRAPIYVTNAHPNIRSSTLDIAHELAEKRGSGSWSEPYFERMLQERVLKAVHNRMMCRWVAIYNRAKEDGSLKEAA